ncbi:MAG: hypothetical protein ACREJX_19070, partial [Polyangiaceae bacterium]
MGKRRAGATSLEWVGGQASLPATIAENGSTGRSTEMVFWIELPSLDVVAHALNAPDVLEQSLVDVLRAGIRKPVFGAPRKPARVRIEDETQAAQIEGAGLGIEVVVGPTPEIDEIAARMRGYLDEVGTEPSY